MAGALALMSWTGWAGSNSNVPLVWDPSADANVAGYRIYYGLSSHNYTSSFDVGKVTSATITLPSGTRTYYFAATTYDATGAESDYSNEATYTPPTPVTYTPPTLSPLSSLSIAENAGGQTVNLSGITLGTGTALSLTASSSNPALIPNPGVVYTSPSASGSLTFTPVQNQFGTATITVTADNGQPQNNVVVRTFVVTVVPPVQPPTLDAIGNVTLAYSSAGQTVNLTGVTAGLGSGNTRLTISAKSSDARTVPSPRVSYVNGAATASLLVKPAANVSGTAVITVTASTGGKSGISVSQNFTVTVLPNRPPTLDGIGNVTLDYSSAGQTVNLTGISTGASGENQRLTISAKSSDARTVPSPRVSYVNGAATASLLVKPTVNVSGTADITVTINDGGKSNNIITRTFTVTVLPNRPPTLDGIEDLTLNFNSPAQTLDLSGIGPGSSGEVQKLSVTTSSDNPKLVSSPKVSYRPPAATGTLTFKPAANASGTAVITVTVNDGGKTNNIFTRTFSITVLPVLTPKVIASPVVVASNPAALLSSTMTANGQFSLTVNGVSGYQYVVEASLDLTHWTPIYTNAAPFTYVDEETGQYAGQFYRAVYQPSP